MMNPKIRFKKSDGSDYRDWQQKKLGDFLSTPVKEEVAVTSTNELLTVKLHNGGIKQAEEKALQFGSTKYYKRHAGQFIYGIQNFHNGAMGIIPNDLDGKCSSAFIPSFDIHGIDTSFFDMYISRPSYYIPKEKYAVGNGSKLIHEKELFEFDIAVPSDIEEQTKIANFLSEIDNLIASSENEVESTKQLKKAMLQKMFPKNGEKVPEIRFPEFTDDWKQRKVSDIAPLQRGFDLPTSQMEEGVYPVVMSNGIGGYHNEYKVKGPGVITGRSGTIGKVHYVDSDYWPHNTSLWVTDFKGNEPKFIYHLYLWLDLSKFGTGSGVPTLNRNDVHDSQIFIPSVNEQRKISEYLDNLDSLITLHQRKVDTYKKFKKAMMQKMFV